MEVHLLNIGVSDLYERFPGRKRWFLRSALVYDDD